MDSTALIWIIVGIVVVLLIVVIAFAVTARGRREKRAAAQHERAEQLRSDARDTELAAREREASAARARADAAAATAAAENAKAEAAQASIDAERHLEGIDGQEQDAAKLRAEQAEKLRKADELDPYLDGASARDGEPDAPVVAEDRPGYRRRAVAEESTTDGPSAAGDRV